MEVIRTLLVIGDKRDFGPKALDHKRFNSYFYMPHKLGGIAIYSA
jgi:hypothetical protein